MKPHYKNILGYYPKRMQRTAFIRTQKRNSILKKQLLFLNLPMNLQPPSSPLKLLMKSSRKIIAQQQIRKLREII